MPMIVTFRVCFDECFSISGGKRWNKGINRRIRHAAAKTGDG